MLSNRGARVEEFETAALPHLKDLYRTAYRLVGSSTQAEDLVQEVYLQAWKSFGRFQPGSDCRAWLYKILFNVISHHRRKQSRSKTVEIEREILEETLADEPPVPENLADEELLTALKGIPDHYREVVLLSDVQDFSYREIAETLGIQMGTVMSRLSRGRKLLRVELAALARQYGIGKEKKA